MATECVTLQSRHLALILALFSFRPIAPAPYRGRSVLRKLVKTTSHQMSLPMRSLVNNFAGCVSLMLLAMLILPARASAAQKNMWGGIAITPSSQSWRVGKTGKQIIATNRITKQRITVSEDISESGIIEGRNYISELSYDIVSLIGPVLTVFQHYYSDSGMHPSYGGSFEVFNLDEGTQRNLSITDLFDEADVLRALLNDSVVHKALGENIPTSITELTKMADGGCEMRFSEMDDSFAFHHIQGSDVAVRFGLPHGCEADRGGFTLIGIYLPIPKALIEVFKQADKNHTLMRDLWRN